MIYSIEARNRICVTRYGFSSFAKNMGKGLSSKHGQRLLDSAKKIYNRCNKIAPKRAIQKTAEAIGDLIGNKIADKITVFSKKKPAEELHNNETEKEYVEIAIHQKR